MGAGEIPIQHDSTEAVKEAAKDAPKPKDTPAKLVADVKDAGDRAVSDVRRFIPKLDPKSPDPAARLESTAKDAEDKTKVAAEADAKFYDATHQQIVTTVSAKAGEVGLTGFVITTPDKPGGYGEAAVTAGPLAVGAAVTSDGVGTTNVMPTVDLTLASDDGKHTVDIWGGLDAKNPTLGILGSSDVGGGVKLFGRNYTSQETPIDAAVGAQVQIGPGALTAQVDYKKTADKDDEVTPPAIGVGVVYGMRF